MSKHDTTLTSDNTPPEERPEPDSTLIGPQSPDDFPENFKGDPLLGVHLDNYLIQELIGSGSFGKVYRAMDEALGRTVAIKILKEGLTDEHESLFAREAKAIAALSKHPAIVEIYQYAEYKGQKYFALEHMDNSVDKLLKKYPQGLPVTLALKIILESAEALEASHKQNILHRDIKPANILLDGEDYHAKLADFGLAQFREGSHFTIEGRIAGSPPYMSPEQAKGEVLDPRSDLFSLGVTLHQLLCNAYLFEGNSPTAILLHICNNERIPLRERRPDLAEPLIALVDKATAHAPEHRFQSAGKMVTAIKSLMEALQQPKESTPSADKAKSLSKNSKPPVARPRWMLIGISSLILLAGLWGVNQLWPQNSLADDKVFARAETYMDQGEFSAAAEDYQTYLQKNKAHRQATYGLALAEAKLGNFPQAEQLLNLLEASHKAELEGVLAYEKKDAAAQEVLRAATSQTNSPYPDVLLAKINTLENHYDQVIELLNNLRQEQFSYAWQFRECREQLARAYYHTGNYPKAMALFERLKQGVPQERHSVIDAYLDQIQHVNNAERRVEVRTSIDRIKAVMTETPDETASNEVDMKWQSRPLTALLLPSVNRGSRLMMESGIGGVFSNLLGEALEETYPIIVVDREHLLEILSEQELNTLSDEALGLRLNQLISARILITCTFSEIAGEDRYRISLTDIETTRRLPSLSGTLTVEDGPDALVEQLASGLWDIIQAQYPVQGRMYQTADGVVITVGHLAGVREGMEFEVYTHPDAPPMKNVTITLSGTPGARISQALLQGGAALNIPEDKHKALYVREKILAQ